jgi:hypothetical protein
MATSKRPGGPKPKGNPPLREGRSFPLRATVYPDGVNFGSIAVLFARFAKDARGEGRKGVPAVVEIKK